MNVYLKCSVSAIALLATFSLAQAQERQGREEGGAAHQQVQSGAMRHEGTPQHQAGRENTGERAGRENTQPKNRQGAQVQDHRTAKNTPAEERQSQQPKGERNAQGTETRQRESNAGAAGKSETLGREGGGTSKRVSIHVSSAQKTELHEAIVQDTGFHRYHSADIHFSVNVGSRIPDDIEFYAPPPRFVEIDPEFRGYMIVVLDDEILVVDPATREIVDVIPT